MWPSFPAPLRFLIPMAAASVLHASTWIEVSNPEFQIFTDAGESAAYQLVTSLQQFDHAIAHSMPNSPALAASSGPVRIYLFRSRQEFAEFQNQPWSSGFTLSSSHAPPLILLYASPKTRETVLHEYVHALVHRGDWKLPRWFEEGLAEFYAHSVPHGKDQLSIGGPVPEYLAELRGQSFPSAWFSESASTARFYAASWAMANMILMSPKYRTSLNDFASSTPGRGPAFDAAVRDLPDFVNQRVWKQETVLAPLPATQDFKVRAIGDIDAEFMLATLLLDAGKGPAARKRYQRMAATHPKDAVGAEAAGLAALSGAHMDLARQEFRRAADLGTTRARVWSELAALERDAGAPASLVNPLLKRAAELDANDYEAAFLLGIHESDEGLIDEAVAHLGAAAKAAPGRSNVWHAYAMALSRANRTDEARAAAKRALRVSSTPEEDRMASDLAASLESPVLRPAAPPVRRKPEVVTSEAWNRPLPDASAEGRFLELLCQPAGALLKIEVEAGKLIELRVADPGQVQLRNSPAGAASTQLRCGPQSRQRIKVGYRTSDKTVLAVEFF